MDDAQSPYERTASYQESVVWLLCVHLSPPYPRTKLTNLYHSYANSVLQALYFCGPFRDLIVQYPDPSTPDALLPPPTIPIPPSVSSPPPTHVRPKSSRKASISEGMFSHGPSQAQTPPNPCTPTITPIPTSPPTLLSALRSLYIHISRNPADKGTVAPRAFIDKLKELNELFRSTMHQDAHEFLNYLLNQIVEEIDEDRKRANGHGNGSAHTNPSGEERALVLPFELLTRADCLHVVPQYRHP